MKIFIWFLGHTQKLRPLIRKIFPLNFQYRFSGWVYSTVEGPAPYFKNNDVMQRILHRLYWLFNPRGEY